MFSPHRDGTVSSSLPARGGGLPQPRRVPARLGSLAALAVVMIATASPRHVRAQDHEADPACAHPQATHDDALEISVSADRISLRARDVPLCAVLTALAAETGITIYGHVADAQRTSVQFERQRLTRVLDRLLGDGGYLLVLTDGTPGSRGWIRTLTPAGAPHAEAAASSAEGAAMPAATDSAESVAREAAVNERRARREAVESAAELDDASAASLLTSALADADAGVREIAVETLAMLDTAHARELLHAAIQDTDPGVRLEVIDTLGDLDDARSAAALERALADPDARVREAAAEYLAERGE